MAESGLVGPRLLLLHPGGAVVLGQEVCELLGVGSGDKEATRGLREGMESWDARTIPFKIKVP